MQNFQDTFEARKSFISAFSIWMSAHLKSISLII